MSEKRTVDSFDLPPDLAAAVNGLIEAARKEGARAERVRSGGASVTSYNGMLIIAHPDMPPHVWNGKTMTPIILE